MDWLACPSSPNAHMTQVYPDRHQRQAGELRGSKKVRMLVAEGQEEPGEGQGGWRHASRWGEDFFLGGLGAAWPQGAVSGGGWLCGRPGYAVPLCKLKSLLQLLVAWVTLNESFYFGVFMKVACAYETGCQEKHSQGQGGGRVLAGSPGAHQLRGTPLWRRGRLGKDSSSVTAGMVIRERLEWDLPNCGSWPFRGVKSNKLMGCDQH